MEYAKTFLMSFCDQTDGRGDEGGGESDDRDDIHRDGGVDERLGERAHHVDAGRDHGGGVDQRGDRRRTAIASGSQTYSGICADLPLAPTSSSRRSR